MDLVKPAASRLRIQLRQLPGIALRSLFLPPPAEQIDQELQCLAVAWMTLLTRAQDTQRLLQSLGVSRLVLIGHSMGGMLAMRYALQYPGKIEKLVMVNP